MGRPLYTSRLLARQIIEPAQAQPPKPTYPVVEKWSVWNSFDPDSDEFFEGDNAVYEAFLSEDEIVERTQMQQRERARLLAERLLREADTVPTSQMVDEELERRVIENESRVRTAMPIEPYIEGYREPIVDLPRDNARSPQDSGSPDAQPARRQPRREQAMVFDWRAPAIDEIAANTTDPSVLRVYVDSEPPVPRIYVDSTVSTENDRFSSPDQPSLSGLQYLSESPRPLIPVDSPQSTSPVPNTPARVSGVFNTSSPSGNTVSSPSPAPTTTPHILSWSRRLELNRSSWVPESPTPREASLRLGSRVPSTPAPLTY